MKSPLFEIKEALKMREVEIKEDASFSSISHIRLGGVCRILAYPGCEDELIFAISEARRLNIPYKILGRMSNVLPPDRVYGGLVIKTDRMRAVKNLDGTVSAECGISLPALAAYFKSQGFSGLEELSGIPGALGGAVYMNSGAYGREISDSLTELRVFDIRKGEIRVIPRSEILFGYRYSPFSEGEFCILSANLAYKQEDPEKIGERMSRIAELRRSSQPVDMPTLGSAFKRPEGLSAAYLIDKCGLKGTRVGGAEVSEKHAGFIVNRGGATSSDYRVLCELIKEEVHRKFGVLLEREVEYLR